jgi:hypothetical protein
MEYYELGEKKDGIPVIDFSRKQMSIKDKVVIINHFCKRMHGQLLYLYSKQKWFIFGNHSWKLLETNNIDNIFLKDIQKYIHGENELSAIAQIYYRLERLCDDSEFNQHMHCICRKYFNRAETIFDLNTSILGFVNGVWDFNERHFRDGKPSDMIYKTVGYEYKEFLSDDAVFVEIDQFFSAIFPDNSLKISFMEMLESSLHKETFDRVNIFNDNIRIDDSQNIVLTNGGSAGKSTSLLFIRKLFGDYFKKINCYSIVGRTIDKTKNDISDSDCELSGLNLQGTRFVEVSESEKGWSIDRPEILDIEKLAYINKQQIVTWHELYRGNKTHKPTFTMTLVGNWTAANIQSWNNVFGDDEIKESEMKESKQKDLFRVYPFETTFVRHESEPQTKYEKKADDSCYHGDKFDLWIQPFMWVLLHNKLESYSQKSELATQFVIQYMKPS